jgi:hypothetical protein
MKRRTSVVCHLDKARPHVGGDKMYLFVKMATLLMSSTQRAPGTVSCMFHTNRIRARSTLLFCVQHHREAIRIRRVSQRFWAPISHAPASDSREAANTQEQPTVIEIQWGGHRGLVGQSQPGKKGHRCPVRRLVWYSEEQDIRAGQNVFAKESRAERRRVNEALKNKKACA